MVGERHPPNVPFSFPFPSLSPLRLPRLPLPFTSPVPFPVPFPHPHISTSSAGAGAPRMTPPSCHDTRLDPVGPCSGPRDPLGDKGALSHNAISHRDPMQSLAISPRARYPVRYVT